MYGYRVRPESRRGKEKNGFAISRDEKLMQAPQKEGVVESKTPVGPSFFVTPAGAPTSTARWWCRPAPRIDATRTNIHKHSTSRSLLQLVMLTARARPSVPRKMSPPVPASQKRTRVCIIMYHKPLIKQQAPAPRVHINLGGGTRSICKSCRYSSNDFSKRVSVAGSLLCGFV